jgi:uncharacterized membrane protein
MARPHHRQPLQQPGRVAITLVAPTFVIEIDDDVALTVASTPTFLHDLPAALG